MDSRYTDDPPLGAWQYFGYNLLYMIPIIGFIVAIIHAIGSGDNIHKRNNARCFILIITITLIICILFISSMLFLINNQFMRW